MKKSVYLDSTIFSFYYDERPNCLSRKDITVNWWQTQRHFYDIYTSFFVLKEVGNPVYPNWDKIAELASQVPGTLHPVTYIFFEAWRDTYKAINNVIRLQHLRSALLFTNLIITQKLSFFSTFSNYFRNYPVSSFV